MEIYRIVKELFKDSAMDGKGSAMYGGRWNFVDTPTVYCASSRALAMLETLVHVGRLSARPLDLWILTISIPDTGLDQLAVDQRPAGWDRTPIVFSSQKIFTDFYKSGRQLALSVPSVVVPEEDNILLNPHHPMMSDVEIVNERRVGWDKRI